MSPLVLERISFDIAVRSETLDAFDHGEPRISGPGSVNEDNEVVAVLMDRDVKVESDFRVLSATWVHIHEGD